MIVLDANILIRAVLGRRVRQILERYSKRGIRFLAPDVAFHDARRYLPLLLEKHNRPTSEASLVLEYLQQLVDVIGPDAYGEFETAARRRLVSRDEQDWPVLAAALAIGCPVWTEDADFFGTGIAVWTTDRVEIYLKTCAAEESEG